METKEEEIVNDREFQYWVSVLSYDLGVSPELVIMIIAAYIDYVEEVRKSNIPIWN